MAVNNSERIVSLTAHLEKVTAAYESALKGNVPAKHVNQKEAYLRFLKKEVEMHAKKIAQLKGI